MINRIIIATDDKRIYDHVKGFGGEVVMTSPEFPSGSDRIASVVAQDTSLQTADVIVNIQGDEPCIDPATIEKMVHGLQNDSSAVMATAAVRCTSDEEIYSTTEVKCVIDLNGQALLFFSRSMIPGNKTGRADPHTVYYKHLGLYAFPPSSSSSTPHCP